MVLARAAEDSTSGSRDVVMSVNFEQQVKTRSWFLEVGQRRNVTRNTRTYVFVERAEELSCLGAPVALVLDEHTTASDLVEADSEWSRVLVLSYHHSSITTFDRCASTGVLSLTRNISQCFSALGDNAAANSRLRSDRGAVAMSLSFAGG